MHRSFFLIGILTCFLLFFPSGVSWATDSGSLIKCPDFSAVYYLAEDGKRYVFPNEKTYFTWYDDFDDIVMITCEELGDYTIGGNIPYKPGTRLLKLQSAPMVYAVESGGVLRPISSEAQAVTFYGEDWASLVDDLPDAFWGTYEVADAYSDSETPEQETQDLRPIDDIAQNAAACSGWYDTHTHLEGGASGEDVDPETIADRLAERMEEHDVGCAVVLNGFPDWQEDLEGDIDRYVDALDDHPSTFIPFFQLEVGEPSELTSEALDDAWEAFEGRIAFRGYGELVFDAGEWEGHSLTSSVMQNLFAFAAEHDLVLLFDIASDQVSQLETMLENYPDTIVLYQGNHVSRSTLKSLLKEYENLYFTADVESMMVGLDGYNSYGDDFVDAYDENYEQWVEDAIDTYVSIIEAAPDRVMWGTDVADSFMFGREEYDRVIDFTERFLEGLDEEYHDRFLFQNAQELFGDGVVVE